MAFDETKKGQWQCWECGKEFNVPVNEDDYSIEHVCPRCDSTDCVPLSYFSRRDL